MDKCPLCGGVILYQGLSTLECRTRGCANFTSGNETPSQPVPYVGRDWQYLLDVFMKKKPLTPSQTAKSKTFTWTVLKSKYRGSSED